jgi:hypothetical protein
MPERTMSLARYRPGFIDQYQALLHSAFWNVPVVDLRCFLGDAEFHDAEHAEPAGAQRLSERVIRFIDEVRAHRVDGRLLAGTPELTARYSDTKCLSSAAAP